MVLSVAMTLGALTFAPTPATAAPTLSPLSVRGTEIVDGYGRTVLLHGVNNVDKEAPYVQAGDGRTLTAQDAKDLARQGFNVVRLGVSFEALMPERGRIDHDFIARVVGVVNVLAAEGIYTLLDNHQDGLSPIWGGNGFPAWSLTSRPPSWEPNPGFPLYYLMPSMNAGWDEVWTNLNGVVDYLGTALAALGEAVRGNPAVAGIELLNEPWPGTAALTCFPIGCPLFDIQYQRVMQQLTDKIRTKNKAVPVWWEPNVTWNQMMPSYLGLSKIRGRNIVIAPHDYCIPSQLAIYLGLPEQLRNLCDVQQDLTWMHVDEVTRRTGRPTVITEFGDEDATVLSNTLERADKRFDGWMYWHYSSRYQPNGTVSWDPLGGAVGRDLVRTYPQATAGTPQSMRFDTATGAFTFTYRPNPRITAPTVIAVSDRHYSNGRNITVDGGSVVGSDSGSTIAVEADAERPVTVTISAR